MGFFGELFGWLPAGIDAVLIWLADVTGSAGLAIILLTIGIRALLYPLTLKQTKSMAAMKELQPKLKEIQEKYKDKPQEQQRKMMELYQQHGVNPLGGCLPLLIQFPFLIALFQVLQTSTFGGADLNFWIWNLAEPAKNPYYILPALSGLTTYIQSAMTITDASQKTLLYIMPIFITWISLNFPAGLVLYWVTSNVFSIVQQYFVGTPAAVSSKGGAAAK